LLVHTLLDLQMEDFLTYSQQILERADGLDSIGVREVQFTLRMSPGFEAEKKELERFLFQNVYRHPRLIDVRQRAATRLQQLFLLLKAYPERLPDRFQRLAAEWGTERAIGVYLAGMTDRFCDDQYVSMVEMGRSQAADWS
jgi:dGTPase